VTISIFPLPLRRGTEAKGGTHQKYIYIYIKEIKSLEMRIDNNNRIKNI